MIFGQLAIRTNCHVRLERPFRRMDEHAGGQRVAHDLDNHRSTLPEYLPIRGNLSGLLAFEQIVDNIDHFIDMLR